MWVKFGEGIDAERNPLESQFEAMFLSTEHSKKDLDYTISKLIEALDNLGIK